MPPDRTDERASRVVCGDSSTMQAREFYRDALGLPETPEPPDLAERGGCWFESDRVKILELMQKVWCQLALLDYNGHDHSRMKGTREVIGAGFVECERHALVRVYS